MQNTEFKRLLKLELPSGQSAFLWGARQAGKSFFLRENFPSSIYYDLLKTSELNRMLTSPHLLREELEDISEEEAQQPIIIDEIQKVPMLLNEVHWLIENKNLSFILCSSSARKLKRGAANLLGGRAWRFTFYPLVYKEIPDFDLLRALNQGLLPNHYLASQPVRHLRTYISDYLKEEIQAEGLVRNLSGFARFLDVVGFSNAEMLNYTNIARESAIDAKTVREYYQILEDTLIGYFVAPFARKRNRELIHATSKFYLFDVGVANYLSRKKVLELKGDIAGKAFEHFIFMELKAYLGLTENDTPIQYWRTKTGLEVDFILNDGDLAIEVKISETPDKVSLKGLVAFTEDYGPKHSIVVCQAPRKRTIKLDGEKQITVLPWRQFLDNLWAGVYGAG